MTENEDPRIQAAREKMQSLVETAYQIYCDGQNLQAAEIYGKAREIAESINDTPASLENRFFQGTALRLAGKLREALSVITPIFQVDPAKANAADIFNAMIDYVHIAMLLPVNLKAIEKAYQQTENFLRDAGKTDWQHNLLLLQSLLYAYRGMLQESLAAAQESWMLWQPDYPAYRADAHLRILVWLNIALRDIETAKNYLQEWESEKNNVAPKNREKSIYECQSTLARLEGRFTEAADLARRAKLLDDSPSDYLVEAFLCRGDIELARNELVRCLAQRHEENGHTRYSIRLLLGDYYLACARQAAGMEPVDDTYGLEFPAPCRIANPTTTRYALARARRAYHTALKVGRWIDEKLECSIRQEEIAERLARLKAIEQWL